MNNEELFDFQSRMNAIKAVIKINDPKKYEDLSKKASFWASEIMPLKYSEWVRENYAVDPNDIVSLNVYSLLTNMSIEQLKEQMIADFGNEPKTR